MLSALAAPYLQVGSVVYPNAAAPYTIVQPGDGKFAHGSFSSIQAPSTLRQSYVQPNPSRSYLMEWNLNIEQDFGHNLSMYLGFVGSKGVHQPFRTDEVNTVQPIGYREWSSHFPKPGTAKVLNPNVGQIAAIFYNNNTYYDGLQAGFTKKMSHGCQAQVSYTYSKAIDLGSAVLAGDPFGNSISGLFYFAPSTRRGVADFNVPNEFTLQLPLQVPQIKKLRGPLNFVANGWEASGIFFAQNGLPFTPTIAGDSLGLQGTAPYNVPNRIKNTAGCQIGRQLAPGDRLHQPELLYVPISEPGRYDCVRKRRTKLAPRTQSERVGLFAHEEHACLQRQRKDAPAVPGGVLQRAQSLKLLAANRESHGVHCGRRKGRNRRKHHLYCDNKSPDSIRAQASLLADLHL